MRITEQANVQLESINTELKEKQQKLKASANEAANTVIGEDLFKQVGLRFQDTVVDPQGTPIELKDFNFKLSKNKEDYICSFTVQYPDEVERMLLPSEITKIEPEVESKKVRKPRTPKKPKTEVIADQTIDKYEDVQSEQAKAEAIFMDQAPEVGMQAPAATPTQPVAPAIVEQQTETPVKETQPAPVVMQAPTPTQPVVPVMTEPVPVVNAAPQEARTLQVKLPTDAKATEYPTPAEAFDAPVSDIPTQYGTPRIAPIATNDNNPFGNA